MERIKIKKTGQIKMVEPRFWEHHAKNGVVEFIDRKKPNQKKELKETIETKELKEKPETKEVKKPGRKTRK